MGWPATGAPTPCSPRARDLEAESASRTREGAPNLRLPSQAAYRRRFCVAVRSSRRAVAAAPHSRLRSESGGSSAMLSKLHHPRRTTRGAKARVGGTPSAWRTAPPNRHVSIRRRRSRARSSGIALTALAQLDAICLRSPLRPPFLRTAGTRRRWVGSGSRTPGLQGRPRASRRARTP